VQLAIKAVNLYFILFLMLYVQYLIPTDLISISHKHVKKLSY